MELCELNLMAYYHAHRPQVGLVGIKAAIRFAIVDYLRSSPVFLQTLNEFLCHTLQIKIVS